MSSSDRWLRNLNIKEVNEDFLLEEDHYSESYSESYF